jgi:hypothetical protein
MGLLLHWWHANKQQPGRGSIGKSAMQHLPIMDVTALDESQLDTAVEIFDATCRLHLMPVHEINNDPVRRQLDNMFATKVLGLAETMVAPDGPLELLRRKLAREPSILGSKG